MNKKGQVTIEMTLALIAVFLLLMGSFKIFIWVNRCLVERGEAYETTRLAPFVEEEWFDWDEYHRMWDFFFAECFAPNPDPGRRSLCKAYANTETGRLKDEGWFDRTSILRPKAGADLYKTPELKIFPLVKK